MQNNQILALIKKKAGSIILFGILVASLSFLLLVVKEKNFKVSTDYLIVQNQTASQDFYTLSKSAEYIGKILKEGVSSELFINEITKTGKVNAEFLPFDKKEKLKQWGNTVQVGLNPDLGIISVQVFSDNQRQAQAIADATAEVLTTKNNIFRGDGQNIVVKVLSGPVVEKNPSIGNISAVSTAGFILGVMLSSLWFVYKNEKRKNNVFMHPMAKNTSGQQIFDHSAMTSFDRMERSGNFMREEEKLQR